VAVVLSEEVLVVSRTTLGLALMIEDPVNAMKLEDLAQRAAVVVVVLEVLVVDGVMELLVAPLLVLVKPYKAEVLNLTRILMPLLVVVLESSTTNFMLFTCILCREYKRLILALLSSFSNRLKIWREGKYGGIVLIVKIKYFMVLGHDISWRRLIKCLLRIFFLLWLPASAIAL